MGRFITIYIFSIFIMITKATFTDVDCPAWFLAWA